MRTPASEIFARRFSAALEKDADRSAAARKAWESRTRAVPKVGETVSHGGQKYVVEPLDGDDTFPPAIASFEVSPKGFILYTGRNGSEGVVAGKPEATAKWIRDVQEEVARNPPKLAEHRDWEEADGGKEHLDRAAAASQAAADKFGVSAPKVRFTVAERPLEGGEHSPNHVSVANAHKPEPIRSLSFDAPGVTQAEHVAAHETMHQVFSGNPDIGRRHMEALGKVPDKVSAYHSLAGNFEGLMELGAAYSHSPEALKKYSPKLYEIAESWATANKKAKAEG